MTMFSYHLLSPDFPIDHAGDGYCGKNLSIYIFPKQPLFSQYFSTQNQEMMSLHEKMKSKFREEFPLRKEKSEK